MDNVARRCRDDHHSIAFEPISILSLVDDMECHDMRKQKRTDALGASSLATHSCASLRNVHAASTAARDVGDSRISVTAVAGDVDVTMAGHAANVAPDSTVLLPAASSRGTTARSVSRRRARTSACRTTRTSRFPRKPSTATSSRGSCSTAATCSTTSRRATSASCASRRRCSWPSSRARNSTSPCRRTARRSRCSKAGSRSARPTAATSCS